MRVLAINWSLWFYNLWGSIETLVETTSSLEELIEVRPAVENPLKGIVVTELEGTSAVMATEASLVINAIISSELIHQIHSLVTGFAFLCGTSKCHCCLFQRKFQPERDKRERNE